MINVIYKKQMKNIKIMNNIYNIYKKICNKENNINFVEDLENFYLYIKPILLCYLYKRSYFEISMIFDKNQKKIQFCNDIQKKIDGYYSKLFESVGQMTNIATLDFKNVIFNFASIYSNYKNQPFPIKNNNSDNTESNKNYNFYFSVIYNQNNFFRELCSQLSEAQEYFFSNRGYDYRSDGILLLIDQIRKYLRNNLDNYLNTQSQYFNYYLNYNKSHNYSDLNQMIFQFISHGNQSAHNFTGAKKLKIMNAHRIRNNNIEKIIQDKVSYQYYEDTLLNNNQTKKEYKILYVKALIAKMKRIDLMSNFFSDLSDSIAIHKNLSNLIYYLEQYAISLKHKKIILNDYILNKVDMHSLNDKKILKIINKPNTVCNRLCHDASSMSAKTYNLLSFFYEKKLKNNLYESINTILNYYAESIIETASYMKLTINRNEAMEMIKNDITRENNSNYYSSYLSGLSEFLNNYQEFNILHFFKTKQNDNNCPSFTFFNTSIDNSYKNLEPST